MIRLIDLPVGTEFRYQGKRYQVIKAPVPGRCDGCTDKPREVFDITSLCKAVVCLAPERHDKIDVIFIEKEESNE